MTSLLRPFLPRAAICVIFAVILAIATIPELLGVVFGFTEMPEFGIGRATILIGACALYGVARIPAFHPSFQPDYFEWLRISPWTPSRPLPLGPIHLVWQDAVILVTLVLLGLGNPYDVYIHGPLAFLVAYLLSSAGVLALTGAPRYSYAILFGLGLAGRLADHVALSAATLLVVCILACAALRATLTRFPWKSPSATRVPGDEYAVISLKPPADTQITLRRRQIGWPYSLLRPQKTAPIMSLEDGVLLCLLAGWLAYVLVSGIRNDHDIALGWLAVGAITLLGPLVRIAIYCANYSSPLSLLGRIATGRWIIPGYDHVFITPTAAFAGGVLITAAVHAFAIPDAYGIPVAITWVLLILINGGPILGNWRLTGHHRIRPRANPETIEI